MREDLRDIYRFNVDDTTYEATFLYRDPITTCTLVQLPERRVFAGATLRIHSDTHNQKEAYKNALRRAVASKFLLDETIPFTCKQGMTSFVAYFTSKDAIATWHKFSRAFRGTYKLNKEMKNGRHA